MSDSSSLREARLALGQRLCAIRQERGLTARELARRCGWHESKCSRIENGHASPSIVDIRLWAQVCEASEQADELISMAHGIHGLYVEWRTMERAGLKQAQERVLPLWEQTQRFKAYAHCMVPGPLQTSAYTRAVLAAIKERRGATDDVDLAVQARMSKQKTLTEGGRQFAVLLEESVLHYRIGDAGLMVGQLSRLLEVAVLPSVSLGVIPRDADRSAMWPVEDFWIFDGRQVNVELVSAFITLKQSREVKQYIDAFADLGQYAVHGAGAISLIAMALAAFA
ncbi:helix-turn-helix domain-containing protein [Streptomyces sp. NPDC051569]|uniref:helix-turn-helix domain-containing protein n=1 Tax=Streptomyces sp. NPDC051569 TaxID=3365661 RepID=UPI00378861CA